MQVLSSESELFTDTGDGWLRSGMVRFHEALRPLLRPIDDVHPAPYNYNNGDVEAIEESIEANGMYRPVFAQEGTEDILLGNHTWEACKRLGSQVVPVIDLDVNDLEAKRIMHADNAIAAMARPDPGLQVSLLNELEEAGMLTGSGMTERDLEVLRHLNEIPLDTDDNDFAQWPTFTVQVPPHVLRGFMYLTREADTDRQRFELVLRLAGWDER